MTTHVRARTYAEAAQELTEIDPRRTGRTLDLLARALDLTDGDIHRLTGISRPTINQKRTGAKPIRAADLWPLAEALGVEIGVLLLPPAEALQWLIDNRREVLDGEPPARVQTLPSTLEPRRWPWQAARCTGLHIPLRDGRVTPARAA